MSKVLIKENVNSIAQAIKERKFKIGRLGSVKINIGNEQYASRREIAKLILNYGNLDQKTTLQGIFDALKSEIEVQLSQRSKCVRRFHRFLSWVGKRLFDYEEEIKKVTAVFNRLVDQQDGFKLAEFYESLEKDQTSLTDEMKDLKDTLEANLNIENIKKIIQESSNSREIEEAILLLDYFSYTKEEAAEDLIHALMTLLNRDEKQNKDIWMQKLNLAIERLVNFWGGRQDADGFKALSGAYEIANKNPNFKNPYLSKPKLKQKMESHPEYDPTLIIT